tara:strand:- start:46 stop:1779 length:1734 start_codon:yes stop_codon:yes gene_type:complete
LISQIKDFKKLIFVLSIKKWDLMKILFLILFATFIELLGLGIIIPFINQTFDLTENTNLKFLNFGGIADNTKLSIFLILLLIIFLLKTIISIFIKWYIGVFSSEQSALLQKKLITLYQNMNYEDYVSKNNSEYVRNIREIGSDCLSNLDLSLKTIAEIIIFFFIICFLAVINFRVLLVISTLFLAILFIYQYFLKPISVKLGEIRNNSIGNIHRYIDLGIRGMKETKILRKDKFFTKNLFHYANIVTETQKKAILIHDSPKHILEFFFLLIGVLFIYYLSVTDQELKNYFPVIGVYLLASVRLLPSISFIIASLNRIAGLYSSTNIIYDDIKKFSIKSHFNKDQSYFSENGQKDIESIKMIGVNFAYKNSKVKVFENINFNIVRNECIGIVGESGSGKTTFVDILLGLLKPTEGKIYVNDQLLTEKNFNLSGNIAYLPQEPLVLEESIQTNITLEKNKKKIDDQKLTDSIKKANLKNVILNLPDKSLDTLIGENGIRLSGGQNKRIALARTFYHGKKFIIMDEATSSLDDKAENYIVNEIENIKGKITIIIISHSKNIMKHCDKIYEVKEKTISLLK